MDSRRVITVCIASTLIVLLVVLAFTYPTLIFKWHIYRLERIEEYYKREAIIDSLTDHIRENPKLANQVFESLLDDETLVVYKRLLARFLFVVPRPDLVEKALNEFERRNDPFDSYTVFELGTNAFSHNMDRLGWKAYDLEKKYTVASKGATLPEATTVLTAAPREEVERIVEELRELTPYVPRNTKMVIGFSLQLLIDDGKTSISVGLVPAPSSRQYFETLHDAVMTSGMKFTLLP